MKTKIAALYNDEELAPFSTLPDGWLFTIPAAKGVFAKTSETTALHFHAHPHPFLSSIFEDVDILVQPLLIETIE
jgi:hypothetical protein